MDVRMYMISNNNSVALVSERSVPTKRPPLAREVSDSFLRIEVCCVIMAVDTYERNLGFLDRSCYILFLVFVIQFHLQFVLVCSANSVKNV
jgi:hypothetical protein